MPKDKKKERRKNIAGGLAAAGGAGAIHKSLPKITGRKRLYHGTTSEAADKIRESGLLGRFTGKAGVNTKNIKDTNPEGFKKSLGKTFTTPSKSLAKDYVAQSELGGPNAMLEKSIEYFKTRFGPKSRKGVVNIKAPTWKMNTVKNPELGGAESFEEFKKFFKKNNPGYLENPLGDNLLENSYKNFKDKTVTFDGDVPTKYIKGSDDYQRAGLSEIKEYAKQNPKKFALGAGGAALGAAGLGYGGYRLYNHLKNRKDEKDMQKQAMIELGMGSLIKKGSDRLRPIDHLKRDIEDSKRWLQESSDEDYINFLKKEIKENKEDINLLQGNELAAELNKGEYDKVMNKYKNLGTATGALAGGGAGLGIGHLIDRKRSKKDAKAGKIVGGLGGAGLGAALGRKFI